MADGMEVTIVPAATPATAATRESAQGVILQYAGNVANAANEPGPKPSSHVTALNGATEFNYRDFRIRYPMVRSWNRNETSMSILPSEGSSFSLLKIMNPEIDISARQEGKRRYKARPRKLVLGGPLLRQLAALAEIQCTQREAARVLGVSPRLLGQFLAEHADAREAWKRGKSLGRVSLRRLLWRQAQVDPAQAQFLAKNWLDDGDDQEDTNNNTAILTDEERTSRILELLAKVRPGSPE